MSAEPRPPIQLSYADVGGVVCFVNVAERPANFDLQRELPQIRVIDAVTGEQIRRVIMANATMGTLTRSGELIQGGRNNVLESRAIRIEWTPRASA